MLIDSGAGLVWDSGTLLLSGCGTLVVICGVINSGTLLLIDSSALLLGGGAALLLINCGALLL